MRHIENYADERNRDSCIHCGGSLETRDHVPSRVFLDEPYPDNLPLLPCCLSCNRSFSLDEEYLACLVEVAKAGSLERAAAARSKIARIFVHTPQLAQRLSSARYETSAGINWKPEEERVRKIVLKLARGHLAYELNESRRDEPARIGVAPLFMMAEDARQAFEELRHDDGLSSWPEVGSRAMSRIAVGSADGYPWIVVQPSQYRYLVSPDACYVRLVIAEYLAAEIEWPYS